MAEASTKTAYSYIVHTSGMVGGEARIDGHRIRVRDIVAARDLGGLVPEEIVASVYPELTLAQGYRHWHITRITTLKSSRPCRKKRSISSSSCETIRN